MVELLMAAFVMGIGLLGLTSLQAMAIRTTGTSARMQDAIRLGEQVLELASAEGTQAYLGERSQSKSTAAPKYLGAGAVTEFYKYRPVDDTQGAKGTLMPATAADQVFTVTLNQVEMAGAGFGQLVQVTVQVQFIEGVTSGGANVLRTVSFTREVIHA